MAAARHDREKVVQKATELFWSRGFHATSMRNLQQAIDLRPGSIYASFGSKEGLFKEALQHYADSNRARFEACIAAADGPLEGLKQFVRDSVIGRRGKAPNEICMLVKTVAELTEEDGDLLAFARQKLADVERTFAAVLEQAQQQGEVDPARDPARMARYLQIQLMGLRAYARTRGSDEELGELIDDIFAHLLPQT